MQNRNTFLMIIGLITAFILLIAVTPEPISSNTATITWVTQPQTTWINVWDVTQPGSGTFIRANEVSSGVTNTLTLSTTTGLVFQIQEYQLVAGRLELVTFFNTNPVPYIEFPTPIEIPQPSVTPIPTATPKPGLKPRVSIPVVMR